MAVLTSTMRMQLDAGPFVAGAKQVADAVERDVKRIGELKAALKDTGGSDRLQASLLKLGATTSHIDGVREALERFKTEQGLVGVAAGQMSAEQRKALRTFESATAATVRTVIAEDKRLTADAKVQAEARTTAARQEEAARVEAVQQGAAATLATERRLAAQLAEQDQKAENKRIALAAASVGAAATVANREQTVRAKIEAEITAKVRTEGQRRIAATQEEALAIERIASHEKELRIRAIQAETEAIVLARHRQAEAEAHAMQHAQDRAGFGHMATQAAAAYVSAHGVVSGGERVLEAGMERQSERLNMANAGISPAEIVRIEDQALRLSAAVGNVGQTKIMEVGKELRSMIQDPAELEKVLDPIIRAKSVIDSMDTTGASSEGIGQLLKAAELVGAAKDPERLTKLIDGWVKVMQVSGKTVNPEQIFEFVKYSKTAGATLSDRFLTTVGPSILQELGGSTTGNDIAMMSKTIATGFGKNHTSMREAARIGLIDSDDIDYLSTGEAKGLKAGKEHAVKGDTLFQTDPDKWVYDVLLPHLEAAGITKQEDQLGFVQRVFTGTSADFIAKTITQRQAYDTHAENYGMAKGLAAVGANSESAAVGVKSLSEAIGNLSANVSAPVMATIGTGLNGLAGWINALAEQAKDHPVAAATAGGVAGAAGLAASGYLSYQIARGFGLPSAAGKLTEAAEAIIAAERGAHPGGPTPGDPGKPGGSPGYTNLLPRMATMGTLLFSLTEGMPEQVEKMKDTPADAPADPALGFATRAGDWVRGHLPGFDVGGWTGAGGRLEPAGVVHKEEFVVKQGPAARHRALLEAMNRGDINLPGFADGGMVAGVGFDRAGVVRVALAPDSASAPWLRSIVAEGVYDALTRANSIEGATGDGDGGGIANLRYGRGASGRYRGTPGTGQDYEVGPHVGLGKMGAKFVEKAPVIMDGLMKKYGLTREQAAGVLGNLGHESGGFTKYHEGGKAPGSGGVGWAQWTGPRRRAFEAWTAAHGLNPTSDEASWRYLTEGDPETAKAIAAVKRQSTVEGSMRAFEAAFERAGIKAYGSRLRFAHAAMAMQPNGASVMGDAPAAPEGAPTVGAHLADMKKSGLLTDEQCVTLAMASMGIGKGSGVDGANVHDWRRGAMADSGRLVPGTPVATFLNRDGSENKDGLYAGGGAGTPGAHLDHAGVFQKYLKDEAGKIVGMTIAEQYQGSGGAHMKDYFFGKGWGEGNASNYAAITLKGGRYLGGTANPMAGGSAVAGGEAGGPAGAAGNAGQARAVDILDKLDGADDKTVSKALGARMHVGEWCADAVNASLEKAGVKGSGSAMSDSFKTWGRHVDQKDLRRGDVIVESGRRPNGEVLGHAGFATGLVKDRAGHITTADKAVGGITAIGMTSGNHGDQVIKNYWENPDLVTDLRRAIRRAGDGDVAQDRDPTLTPKRDAAALPEGKHAGVDLKVSGLDDLREAHAHIDGIHRKVAGLGNVNLKVRHEGMDGDHGHAPSRTRTVLNGSFGGDGRAFG